MTARLYIKENFTGSLIHCDYTVKDSEVHPYIYDDCLSAMQKNGIQKYEGKDNDGKWFLEIKQIMNMLSIFAFGIHL